MGILVANVILHVGVIAKFMSVSTWINVNCFLYFLIASGMVWVPSHWGQHSFPRMVQLGIFASTSCSTLFTALSYWLLISLRDPILQPLNILDSPWKTATHTIPGLFLF